MFSQMNLPFGITCRQFYERVLFCNQNTLRSTKNYPISPEHSSNCIPSHMFKNLDLPQIDADNSTKSATFFTFGYKIHPGIFKSTIVNNLQVMLIAPGFVPEGGGIDWGDVTASSLLGLQPDAAVVEGEVGAFPCC